MKDIMIIGMILLATALPSCQKLTEDPKGSLVNESFFKTESDLDAAVTAVYSRLVMDPWGGFGSTRIWVPLMGADDLTTLPGGNKQDFKEFDIFAPSNLNGAMRNAAWSIPYNVIYAANNVIVNATKVDGRAAVIDKSVAQARFLRAFSYFWIVRIFGEIPLVTTVDISYDIGKAPIADIYQLIIEDLQFAESNLQDSWPGEPGRPTTWSAKGLLAQVYLTMAGWPLKNDTGYTLAAAKAKEIMDGGPYRLLDNFADLWPIANENNEEIVWSIQFCSVEKCNSPYFMTHGGYTTMPSEEAGWDDIFFEVGFYNRFPPGPRKDETFHTLFTDGTDFENGSTKHPYIKKFRSGAVKDLPGYETDFMTSRNLNYLRLAEVMLIYAEAQNMADGAPNADAYAAVNAIRDRAGLDDLPAGLSSIDFRDAIIDERGWELAAEFSRWFDLVRTEKVEEMNAPAMKDPVDLLPGSISKDNYLAPVPYSEILLNPKLAD